MYKRQALECVEAGADKVRINPGNIGGADRVKAVARACARRNIPIRIGVNGGSLEKPILAKYGGVTPQAMVDSAFGHIALLNRYDFDDICVSLKMCIRDSCTSYEIPGLRPSLCHAGNGPPTGWAGWGRGWVPFGKRQRGTVRFPTFSSRQ